MVGQQTKTDEADCGQVEMQERPDLAKLVRNEASPQLVVDFCIRKNRLTTCMCVGRKVTTTP